MDKTKVPRFSWTTLYEGMFSVRRRLMIRLRRPMRKCSQSAVDSDRNFSRLLTVSTPQDLIAGTNARLGFLLLCGLLNKPHYGSCPPICHTRAPSLRTKRQRKTIIVMNVSQGRSESGYVQFSALEVKDQGCQTSGENDRNNSLTFCGWEVMCMGGFSVAATVRLH